MKIFSERIGKIENDMVIFNMFRHLDNGQKAAFIDMFSERIRNMSSEMWFGKMLDECLDMGLKKKLQSCR